MREINGFRYDGWLSKISEKSRLESLRPVQIKLRELRKMVKDQLSLIEEVQAESWWTDITPWMIDYLWVYLRDLVKFSDRKEQLMFTPTSWIR
ncbi:MAG: hypothetical protein AB1589_27550 [Cyanobacteriota bacterium]